MNRLHPHPQNPREKISGRLLHLGDVLQRGDKYSSEVSGTWEPILTTLAGKRLQTDSGLLFVRPAKKKK